MPAQRRATVGDYALGLIACVAFVACGLVLFAPPPSEIRAGLDPRSESAEARPFSYEVLGGGGLRLRGAIRHGATERLETLLGGTGAFRYIEFDSPGGLVAEARGLIRLIEAHGLETFVGGDCLSACALAFASGRKRMLAPGARLGFHAYRLNSSLVGVFLDPEAELQRDLAVLRRRLVDDAFIERVAATPHEAMWFPSHEELIAARVVDMIGHPR